MRVSEPNFELQNASYLLALLQNYIYRETGGSIQILKGLLIQTLCVLSFFLFKSLKVHMFRIKLAVLWLRKIIFRLKEGM